MSSLRARESALTRFWPASALEGWARSIAPATLGSTGRSLIKVIDLVAGRGAAGARTVSAGSAGDRPPQSPQHLHGIRRRPGRRRGFLVMELLEGETLAERLERGAVPLDEPFHRYPDRRSARRATPEGVIHRDLKPSNVMLTAAWAKLLDFGLAKLRDQRIRGRPHEATKSLLTGEGTVLGTLPYMAPEQVEGRGRRAHRHLCFGVRPVRNDHGAAPFQGASRASLTAAILTHEPPRFRRLSRWRRPASTVS